MTEGKREYWIEMQEYFMTEYDENGQLMPIKESSEWKIPVNHRGWITISETPIEKSVHVIEYAEVERLKSQLQVANEIIKKNMGMSLEEIILWRQKNNDSNI